MLLYERPYLDAWLKRTRRQLAPSGRISELALILSRQEGHEPGYWSKMLRAVLEGEAEPTLDFVTSIDTLLARPRVRVEAVRQRCLW